MNFKVYFGSTLLEGPMLLFHSLLLCNEKNEILWENWGAVCLSELKIGFKRPFWIKNNGCPIPYDDKRCWLIDMCLLISLLFCVKSPNVTTTQRSNGTWVSWSGTEDETSFQPLVEKGFSGCPEKYTEIPKIFAILKMWSRS